MKVVKDFMKKVLGAKVYIWIVVAVLAIFFIVAKTYNIIGFFQGKNASKSNLYANHSLRESQRKCLFGCRDSKG